MRLLRIAVVVVAAFCGVAALGAQATRDSAGIRIVSNAAPAWTSATKWRLDPKPVVVLGSSDNSDTELRVVMGASRLSDGRIAVADMDVGAIRLFDPSGKLVKSIGRSGRGPGEFTQLMGVRVGRADSIIGIDAMGGVRQLNVYSPDGRWSRAQLLHAAASEGTTERGSFGGWDVDGSWLEFSNRRAASSAARHTDSVAINLMNAAGRVLSRLGPFPESESGGTKQRSMPVEFGMRGGGDLFVDRIVYGFPDRYQFTAFDRSGRPTMIVRRDWLPHRITPVELEAFKKDYATPEHGEGGGVAPSGLRRLRLSNLDQMLFAETFPAFNGILFDRAGNIWVREPRIEHYFPGDGWNSMPTVPTNYSIFDRSGRWLGDLAVPAHFVLKEIGADYLLGVTLAADGVERVTMLRLVKPRG